MNHDRYIDSIQFGAFAYISGAHRNGIHATLQRTRQERYAKVIIEYIYIDMNILALVNRIDCMQVPSARARARYSLPAQDQFRRSPHLRMGLQA